MDGFTVYVLKTHAEPVEQTVGFERLISKTALGGGDLWDLIEKNTGGTTTC